MEQQKEQNIDEMIKELGNSVRRLDEVYDVQQYLYAMTYQTGQLDYYYSNFADGEDYTPRLRPTAGQVAYINLTYGFPKELNGGHWCYIVKDIGCKLFVIPMCSVKAQKLNNLDISDNPFSDYIDVYFDSHIHTVAKLNYTDARVIDVQRIDTRKPFGTVKVSREHIVNRFAEIML